MLTPEENKKVIDDYDYLANAASAGDCTGLIPSLPTSETELESYQDVYQYHPSYSQVWHAANDKNSRKDSVNDTKKDD